MCWLRIFWLLLAAYQLIRAEDSVASQLEKWFQRNGGRINKIAVGQFAEGRGIQTMERVEEGDEVLHIPASLILSQHAMLKHSSEPLRLVAKALEGDEAVVVWLLFERQLGSESQFHPYIQALPAYVPSLLYFTDEELLLLQDGTLLQRARSFQLQTRTSYHAFLTTVTDLLPSLTNTSWAAYAWATTILNSRGLRFRSKVYLSPMADFFNYHPHPSQRAAQGGEFFLKHHQLYEDGSLSIFADRSSDSGQQLFQDYGDNGNDIYLTYHGFVPSLNPFHCYYLADSLTRDYTRRLNVTPKMKEILNKIRITSIPTTCITDKLSLGKPLEVFISVISMDNDDIDKCLAIVRSPNGMKWPAIDESCGFRRGSSQLQHLANDSPQFLALRKVVAESIKASQFPTSIVEDQILIRQCNRFPKLLTENQCLAVQYRLSTKQLLSRICSRVGLEFESLLTMNHSRSLSEKVLLFNSWYSSHHAEVPSLKASLIEGYRIGTVAVSPIKKEEVYLKVPMQIILSASTDDVSPHLMVALKAMPYRDDFLDLCLILLYERFVLKFRSTRWPYLSLLPSLDDVDVPLLWTDNEVKDPLSASFIMISVLQYKHSVRRKFEELLKIDAITKLLGKDVFTYDNYAWGTLILDSRSIWWDSRRHLVPMLDFINCKPLTDTKRVHSTVPDAERKFALTKAADNFKEGEQVFENYGQPNHIYFTYHGFTVTNNSHDCVVIEIPFSREEANKATNRGFSKALKMLGLYPVENRPYRGLYSTCASVPIAAELYIVLNLKHVEDHKYAPDGEAQLWEPSITATRWLLKFVQTRLEAYAESRIKRISHAASQQFIRSEKRVWLSIKKNVKEQAQQLASNKGEEL